MHERWIRAGDAGLTRLLWMFAVLAVLFLVTLAVAPARSYFREWRATQQRYGRLAAGQGQAAFAPAIQQIWEPRLGLVDRCTSCHLGMGAAPPHAGDKVFRAHPPVPHDPAEYGCTLCHGGQGRATTTLAAHGNVKHWDEPMLERPYFQAGCGACHRHLPVPAAGLAARGADLFQRYDCLACHLLDGVGRGIADLSATGITGVPSDWHARHQQRQATLAAKDPRWTQSYGPIPEAEVAAIGEYLKGRWGAPRLTDGKLQFHRLGCRGCHTIDGVGGDEGPDLSSEAKRALEDLDFTGVRGPRTMANWQREHLREPGRVVAGSRMPNFGLGEEQIDLLTLYLLSLRPLDLPVEKWPKDRLRVERLGERPFAADGETLFGVLCTGCHGPRGEGRRYPVAGPPAPAIGGRDFLAAASDALVRDSITRGRPGRRMPAWGERRGGLVPAEVEGLVRYLRNLQPGTPAPEVAPPAGDATRGRALYAESCGGCHGPKGEGPDAPALANAGLRAASDAFLFRTVKVGRRGTGMRGFAAASWGSPALTDQDLADIVAHVRVLAGPAKKEPR